MENGLPPKNIMDAIREQQLEAEILGLRTRVAGLEEENTALRRILSRRFRLSDIEVGILMSEYREN